MYTPATSRKCDIAEYPAVLVASSGFVKYAMDNRNRIKQWPIPPGPGSMCRKALEVAWPDLTGRKLTSAEYKKFKARIYVFVPRKPIGKHKSRTVLHLRSAPSDVWPHWAISLRSHVSSELSGMLRAARAHVPKQHIAYPVLRMLNLSSPLSTQDRRDFRLRIVKHIVDKGYTKQILSQIREINQRAIDTLVLQQSGQMLSKDHWAGVLESKDGSAPWWHLEMPELVSFFKAKRRRMRDSQPAVNKWVGAGFTRENVLKLVEGVDWMIGAQKLLIETVMTQYFKKNDRLLPVHMNMDLSFSNLTKDDVVRAKGGIQQVVVAAAIAGSGPIVLKLMQQVAAVNGTQPTPEYRGCESQSSWLVAPGIAEESEQMDFDALTESVFNHVPGLTEEELALMREKVPSKYFQNMGERLGSASLAEAREIKGRDDLVIKFLRVQYAHFYLCEVDFLLHSVWPKIEPTAAASYPHVPKEQRKRMIRQAQQLLLFLVVQFAGEFDYESEFRNTQFGREMYHKPEQQVETVEAVYHDSSAVPFIVQTRAPGISVNRYLELANLQPPKERKRMLALLYDVQSKFAGIWTKETLLGSGKFHADAHGGNMFISEEGPHGPRLTLIDFGSFGQLNPVRQCQLLDALLISSAFENLNEEIPGAHLRDLSRMILRRRQVDPLSFADLSRAVQSFGKSKLTREEQALLLSDFSRPNTVAECEVSASIQKLISEVRFSASAQCDEQQYEQLSKLLRCENDPELLDFLVCFRGLGKLSPVQRQMLVAKVQKNRARYFKIHKQNKSDMSKIVERLGTPCQVREEKQDIPVVAIRMIDYNLPQDFGTMFMNFVLTADTIGSCTAGAVAMFGRGISYVTGINADLHKTCADEEKCPVFELESVMSPALSGSVGALKKNWRQLVNRAMKKPTDCTALIESREKKRRKLYQSSASPSSSAPPANIHPAAMFVKGGKQEGGQGNLHPASIPV